ncbi:MAG: SDR family oxidoreductase [Firmicutes bacterium]|nr:SDR family oxidoreductase [Bacillota bacterium]
MNKVWMITGASRGLGRAFAEEAVRNGDKVIAGVRKLNHDDELFRDENVLPVIMDVTKPDEIRESVEKGAEKFGRIDYLVNNAGFGMNGAFEEISDEELRMLFETDYFGVVNVCRAVIPVMRKQRSGRIFNVSSQAGIMGFNGGTVYCAAKFAVIGLSESLNNELNQFGIQTAAVAPGAFRTDFRDESSVHFPKNPMPEYDATPAHTMIEWMKENNHKQAGDPAKAAKFLYKIAGRDILPQIITIGKDCSDASIKHYENLLREIESYYEDSCKTAFEE